jgi:hypothetical protein
MGYTASNGTIIVNEELKWTRNEVAMQGFYLCFFFYHDFFLVLFSPLEPVVNPTTQASSFRL